MYNELFTRSFSKQEQKKLSIWALFGCFVMALSFCALLNAYMSPLPLLNNFQITTNIKLKVLTMMGTVKDHEEKEREAIVSMTNTSKLVLGKEVVQVEKVVDEVQVIKKIEPLPLSIKCNFSLPRTDFCEVTGDVRIRGKPSMIFLSPSLVEASNITTWKLKPYARKVDKFVKEKVSEITIGPPSSFGLHEMPKCSINHTVPSIVFSTGGYVGNHFHEFSDVLVPLYITARPFNGEVQFVLIDIKPWWLIKHKAYLDALSKYNIIDMDNSEEVHCFTGTVVGLKGHKEFGIDPSITKEGYSMRSFTQFLRSAYSLRRSMVYPIKIKGRTKPRLLIISRKGSRSVVNEGEVAAEAKRLGYKVVIVDARKNLRDFSKMINSFDVMVGVHGAGLTNSVFLPENAILVQIVPLGLEWLSKNDFEMPANSMNLRYLEYKISSAESSLAEHPLIKNQKSTKPQGWFAFKKLFLDGQNVRIDINRFRPTLLKALELLRK